MASIRSRIISWTDTGSPCRFSNAGRIGAGAVILLLLLPSLFFPFDSDSATFFVCAQKIARGGIHYVDYLEIKPPLVHHLYAVGMLLFGETQQGVRAFDLILQSLTCLMIIGVVRIASNNDAWAFLAALCYALLYVGLTYDGTAQTESYVGLLAIPAARLALFHRTPRGFFGAGLLGGLLCMLKFPFGIVMIGTIAAGPLILGEPWKSIIRSTALMLTGAASIFALFALYLFGFGAYDEFTTMNRFMRGYAMLQWGSIGGWTQRTLQEIPNFFADRFSILLSLGLVVATASSLIPRSESSPSLPRSILLLRLSTLIIALLGLSVIVEGKFGVYHYSRIYPFAVIPAAFGVLRACRILATRLHPDRYAAILIPTACALLLVFSPLPRYARHASVMVRSVVEGETAIDRAYGGDRNYTRRELNEIGEYLRTHRTGGDRIFVASSISALVNYKAGYVPDFPLFFSPSMAAPFVPREWIEASSSYLVNRRPTFIVAQKRDSMPSITGSPKSSIETLLALPGVDTLIQSSYDTVLETPAFEVYRRRR